MTIPVAHDFICPWCWAGYLQAKKLRAEYGVTFDWIGYELYPAALEWPAPQPPKPEPPNKPKTPSRLDFLLLCDGIEMPKKLRPKQMRTHNAHLAVEFAKRNGLNVDVVIETLYVAYWERGEEINSPDVLKALLSPLGVDGEALDEAIEKDLGAENLVGFDDDAYANGVYNVPTFFIGGERYAEQPFVVLAKAVEAAR